jgi:hypothetical protein
MTRFVIATAALLASSTAFAGAPCEYVGDVRDYVVCISGVASSNLVAINNLTWDLEDLTYVVDAEVSDLWLAIDDLWDELGELSSARDERVEYLEHVTEQLDPMRFFHTTPVYGGGSGSLSLGDEDVSTLHFDLLLKGASTVKYIPVTWTGLCDGGVARIENVRIVDGDDATVMGPLDPDCSGADAIPFTTDFEVIGGSVDLYVTFDVSATASFGDIELFVDPKEIDMENEDGDPMFTFSQTVASGIWSVK